MIKAILTDFDNTLFDTRCVKPNWEQGKPDWKAIFARVPECPLYEGWKETITDLRGIPLGIVSRNFKGLIYRVLGYNELHHTFNPVIDRYGIGKHEALPKTELFALAMQHERFKELKRSEIIYLGDETTDIVQANQFGFLSGACLWGTLQPKTILTANPTFTLDSPSDLMSILCFSAE